MSNLDALPPEVRKQLEEALEQKDPVMERAVEATVEEITKKMEGNAAAAAPIVVQMDAEDKLRVENISLKEALLRSRADAANAEINRSRQELKNALMKKHGLSSDDKFEINVGDGTVTIKRA
jgi:phage terminase small subunit